MVESVYVLMSICVVRVSYSVNLIMGCVFMHRENWDDLRYVLAVADEGSVSGAARILGVNHATVIRRIAAFEERHGSEIFERTPLGYQIPQSRQLVINAIREVYGAVEAVERTLVGSDAQVSGVIRLTSTDSLAVSILPQVIAGLGAASPGLSFELHSTNAHLDLSRLHADITIRPSQRLSEELIGERAGTLRVAVYAPRGWPDAPQLSLRGNLARTQSGEWNESQIKEDEVVNGSDSFVVLREMVGQRIGRAVLPEILGENDPRLEKIDVLPPHTEIPIWVASHADFGDSPRLRKVRDMLATALREHPLLR